MMMLASINLGSIVGFGSIVSDPVGSMNDSSGCPLSFDIPTFPQMKVEYKTLRCPSRTRRVDVPLRRCLDVGKILVTTLSNCSAFFGIEIPAIQQGWL